MPDLGAGGSRKSLGAMRARRYASAWSLVSCPCEQDREKGSGVAVKDAACSCATVRDSFCSSPKGVPASRPFCKQVRHALQTELAQALGSASAHCRKSHSFKAQARPQASLPRGLTLQVPLPLRALARSRQGACRCRAPPLAPLAPCCAPDISRPGASQARLLSLPISCVWLGCSLRWCSTGRRHVRQHAPAPCEGVAHMASLMVVCPPSCGLAPAGARTAGCAGPRQGPWKSACTGPCRARQSVTPFSCATHVTLHPVPCPRRCLCRWLSWRSPARRRRPPALRWRPARHPRPPATQWRPGLAPAQWGRTWGRPCRCRARQARRTSAMVTTTAAGAGAATTATIMAAAPRCSARPLSSACFASPCMPCGHSCML